MSAIETFFTFAFACTFAVGLLATWYRFTNKSSNARRI